jgi:phosphatidylserine decarboxylase
MDRTTREGAPIAREGYPFIGAGVLLTVLTVIAGWGLVALLMALLTAWVVWFFRNPARMVPGGDGLVLAPADGRVIRVPREDGGGQTGPVSIFMNIFNVHVNRLAVTGRVEDVAYTPGRFVNASFDKASEHNERNRVRIETPDGHTVDLVQIAGLVARRIVCWAAPGTTGRAGDIFGLIRFGSRVDVHLPPGTDVWVVEGQPVTAGETILGKLP